MKAQKMTKQVAAMVTYVNDYLKENHVKDTSDSLFWDMCELLLKAGCYHGYNLFTETGCLAGGENENFDHLEIYVK